MSFSIEVRPQDKIVVATIDKDFDLGQELEVYVQELRNCLDQLPQPSALITVVDEVAAGFGDVVTGLGFLTQGKLAILGHPNISEIIVVTTNNLFTLSAKALSQSQYGSLRVSVAPTLGQAIEHIKQAHSVKS